MTKAPTLIDELYRLSFSKSPVPHWRSNAAMRQALHSARRFVVSDKMSTFMADLANEAFMKQRDGKYILIGERAYRIADSLRVSSRLPHATIWIEYNLLAYQIRSIEIRKPGYAPDIPNIPEHEGWLIQQHPQIETACIMHLFTKSDRVHEDGYSLWTFPFAFGWTCDGNPLPWHTFFEDNPENTRGYAVPSSYLVGLPGYVRGNVNAVRSPLIEDPNPEVHYEAYTTLIEEWTGVIRRVWSLLATIDHLPLTRGNVRQSKGFLARGQIRKFLDHQTITLNIPGKKDPRVLARKVIAEAHRKRHEVRAHWRDDFRHPPSKKCNLHLWELLTADDPDTIECTVCKGRQFHVAKHERGDSALGYVTHDYKVKHDEEHAT